MAVCPICHEEGELCKECPKCHWHYVEAADLRKSHNDEMLGDLVGGQYVPLALIGEGGMGKIYRAKNKYIGKIVALKILKSEYMEDETLKDRFFREAEVVAALDHPNIVKLYGCAPDEKHNNLFMAMELLNGRSLFDLLAQEVPDLKTILKFFCEISSALGEAHKHGIFHRDLKPENVFIIKDENGDEHAKVLDFGFARLQGASKKLTMAGVAFGTPHYMSPEQAMGLDEITAACDVYALGIMLFQAISGHVPFDADSPMEVMRAQVYNETPICTPRAEYHASKRLLNCIYKCMKKQPQDRYDDGNELYTELSEIESEVDAAEKEFKRETVIIKPVKADKFGGNDSLDKNKKMMMIIGGAIALVLIIILVGVILWVI